MHGIIQLNMFYNDLHHKIFSASRPSGDRLPEGDFFKAERPKEEAESKEYDDCHGDDYHQVSFVGEPGLDMGGLTKEWFQVLKTFSSFFRQIFTKSEHDTFKTKLQNKLTFLFLFSKHFFPFYVRFLQKVNMIQIHLKPNCKTN